MTAAERMKAAVYRHNLKWTDISERVRTNTGVDKWLADELVMQLIEEKTCCVEVAVAIIDLITEKLPT